MLEILRKWPLMDDLMRARYWRHLVKYGQRKSLEAAPGNMEEPIDFVVTWVDGSDPCWRAEKENREPAEIRGDGRDNGDARYRDWGLFPYWFRAVEAYAPWVRRVYLVTCGQVPGWLNLDHPKLKLVTHRDILPGEALPTFNSNAIEMNLHRIPGLSEYFVYFNDDMFLNRPAQPEDFFRGGLPNLTALARPLVNESNSAFDHGRYTVCGTINRAFQGRIGQRIECHPEKWFADCYGNELAYNLRAAQANYLPGMYFSHLPVPFRKSSFEGVWRAFPRLMAETTAHRFRTAQDAMHQIFSLWDMLEGRFCPVSPAHHGALFWDPVGQEAELTDAVVRGGHLAICINDSEMVSPADYLALKDRLHHGFLSVFPEKSNFEK